jgi:hypothetical protein
MVERPELCYRPPTWPVRFVAVRRSAHRLAERRDAELHVAVVAIAAVAGSGHRIDRRRSPVLTAVSGGGGSLDRPTPRSTARRSPAGSQTATPPEGFEADSAAERQALGQAIAALAKELKSAPSLVARKAIVADILALTEQRERGPFTAAERAELKAAVAALKDAVIARTDRGAEGREVAAAFSALHEQFTCRPA